MVHENVTRVPGGTHETEIIISMFTILLPIPVRQRIDGGQAVLSRNYVGGFVTKIHGRSVQRRTHGTTIIIMFIILLPIPEVWNLLGRGPAVIAVHI